MRTVDGGIYSPNKFQQTLAKYWYNFWYEWLPSETRESQNISVVLNGDIIDGVHHNTVNIVTNSVQVQEQMAIDLLSETFKNVPFKIDRVYFVKGTEAHVSANGQAEERIARAIGAEKNENDEYASYQWFLDVDGITMNFAHHISSSSSSAYETSAPMRELINGLIEASQWGQPMPRIIVRSHRHRFVPVEIPSIYGPLRCVVTPAWQLKTPYVEKVDRMRMPHIGGIILKCEDKTCEISDKLYPLPGPKVTRV